MKKFLLALAIAALGLCLAGCAHQPAWPRVPSAIARSDAVEAQVALMVSQMTLAQKVGQMTQPEIGHVTPAQVTQFYIGSVLNGGGSWPNGNRAASVGDWLALAERFRRAFVAAVAPRFLPPGWSVDAPLGRRAHGPYSAVVRAEEEARERSAAEARERRKGGRRRKEGGREEEEEEAAAFAF